MLYLKRNLCAVSKTEKDFNQPLQPSLFAMIEPPDAFKKAVQVVHSKPKKPLSLVQRKIGNAWIKHALSEDSDSSGWWTMSLKALEADVNFNSNDRKSLRESAEALMSVVFEWDVVSSEAKRSLWKASVLFPEIELYPDKVKFQFSTQMRERLLNPEVYAMIDMNIVRKFRRAASLAIWEHCVRYKEIKHTPFMDVAEFRDMILGEDSGNKTYDEYKFFKSKILKPAIAEIATVARIELTIEEEKVGKKVARIRFLIAVEAKEKQAPDSDIDMKAVAEIVKFGVPQSEARQIVAKQDNKDVWAAISYTKSRIGDKNLPKLERPAPYFRKALENNYARDTSSQGSAPAVPEAPKVDIKAAYNAKRLSEAEAYFKELEADDQARMMDSYNQSQPVTNLRLGAKKAGKAASVAFFGWLASETWGEPTPEELLVFAQSLL